MLRELSEVLIRYNLATGMIASQLAVRLVMGVKYVHFL